jgi:hypothetical protein
MIPRTRDDVFRCYAYVLIYVDDMLAISEGMNDKKKNDYSFKMKKGSMGDSNLYLGSKLRNVTLLNGVEAWMMSPAKYVKEAVKNVGRLLGQQYDSETSYAS